MTQAADNPQKAGDEHHHQTDSEEAVSFGFEQVSPEEKTRRVDGVFAAVADRYDLMNDLMSLGTHRLFKRMVLQMAGVREGHHVLDLAGGTGDISTCLTDSYGEPPERAGYVVKDNAHSDRVRRGRDSSHSRKRYRRGTRPPQAAGQRINEPMVLCRNES